MFFGGVFFLVPSRQRQPSESVHVYGLCTLVSSAPPKPHPRLRGFVVTAVVSNPGMAMVPEFQAAPSVLCKASVSVCYPQLLPSYELFVTLFL